MDLKRGIDKAVAEVVKEIRRDSEYSPYLSLGQRSGAIIHFLKEAQQLTLHARFDEFVVGQKSARFDV